MSDSVVIINTHPGSNPDFVEPLVEYVQSVSIQPEVMDGYDGKSPLIRNPAHVILTGVPLSANYSLSDRSVQKVIEKNFGWLRDCQCPVLGVCYGLQILTHIFGGEVSQLPMLVKDDCLQLSWNMSSNSSLFPAKGRLVVFAEHRDYVSKIPNGFDLISKIDQVPYIVVNPHKRMIGMQFVPEQSDRASQELLRRFLES